MHGGHCTLNKKFGDFSLLAGNLPGPMREKEPIFVDCATGITGHRSYRFLSWPGSAAMAMPRSLCFRIPKWHFIAFLFARILYCVS